MSKITRGEGSGSDGADDRKQVSSDRPRVREYSFGPFRVDVTLCRLWRDQDLVPLTPKAFDTLLVLLQGRDELVSKERLMSAIWPDSFVSEETLTQNIWAIRRALGDDSNRQEYIATVPKRGYRFTAAVEEQHHETSAEARAGAANHTADAGEPHRGAVAAIDVGAAPLPAPTFEATDAAAGDVAAAVVPPAGARAGHLTWAASAALVLFAGVLIWFFVAPRFESAAALARPAGPIRFTQDAPRGNTLVSGGVISPDGKAIAFVAQDLRSGLTQIWVRRLDAAEPYSIAGTAGALRPFWSPDSLFIGFFEGGRLKRVAVSGDQPQVITNTVGIRAPGASWGTTGQIVFATSNRSGLFAVPASGGEAVPVTTLDESAKEVAHRWPHFLPDGRHFLFTVVSGHREHSGVYVGSLDSRDRIPILREDAAAVYASPGYLLHVKASLLIAQPFDVSQLRLTGSPFTVLGNAQGPGIFSATSLSASSDGLLSFGGGTTADGLSWFDRSGRELDRMDLPLHNMSYSYDGRQVIGTGVSADEGGGVWLIDVLRKVPTQIVPNASAALWSPDGRQVVYSAEHTVGRPGLYLKTLDGSESDAPLLEGSQSMFLNDWTDDGRYLVYVIPTNQTKQDVWILPLTGDRVPRPYLQTVANELQAQVSPDSRLSAYASDESGTWEVYLDSFPVPSAKRRISLRGGTQPQWSRSGAELFYLAPDHSLVAVPMAGGRAGSATTLLRAPTVGGLTNYRNHYAVSPSDGQFLFEFGSYRPITIIFNWAISGAFGAP